MDMVSSRQPPRSQADFPKLKSKNDVKLLILKYFTNKSLFLKDLAIEGAKSLILKDRT